MTSQFKIDAQQIAHNTRAELHDSQCVRRHRPVGELVDQPAHFCTCWVLDAAMLDVPKMTEE